jgi:hypothetical protein
MKNLAVRFVLNGQLNNGLGTNIDLSPAFEVNPIVVRAWDPKLKSAECSGRFSLNGLKMWRLAKENASLLTNQPAREAAEQIKLEGFNDHSLPGEILYSVKATSEGKWWIEIQDLRPG